MPSRPAGLAYSTARGACFPVTTTDANLRRIDALVAEKVMGLQQTNGDRWTYGKREVDYGEPLGRWITQSFVELPHFTTSWDAAGQVVERMREPYGLHATFTLIAGRTLSGIDVDRWTAIFTDCGPDLTIGKAIAVSAPLAIGLAALRALGVDPDQHQAGEG